MSQTYCGKTCEDCVYKEPLNCPSCKAGPGKMYGGDCELSQCVRSKGHDTCDSCLYKGNCGKLRDRDLMPDYRRRKAENAEMRKAAMAKRASSLRKWLWIMFWLFIPGTIAGFMAQDMVAKFSPGIYQAGLLLDFIVYIAYGVIMIGLVSEERRYRTAGICILIASGINILAACIPPVSDIPIWTLLLSAPAAIVGLIAEYNEFTAHSAVLTGVDSALSEKWTALWKWYIGLLVGLLACLLIMWIFPILGALAALAAAVGMLVVSILKLVYLYRTAKAFRKYPIDQ